MIIPRTRRTRIAYITEATAKSHLIRIYGKLNVADRTAAVTKALEQGILRLGLLIF